MDMSFFVVLWIIFIVVQNVFEKKKPTSNPPPNLPKNNSPDFEIPTLANDPNFPSDEQIILSPNTRQSAEVQEINLAELYRQKKFFAQTETKKISPQIQVQEVEEVEQKNFSANITAETAMNAIIWSEILGKPKARRR